MAGSGVGGAGSRHLYSHLPVCQQGHPGCWPCFEGFLRLGGGPADSDLGHEKKLGNRMGGFLVSLFFVPVVLFFLFVGLNKTPGLHLSLTFLMVIYVAALVAIFLVARRVIGRVVRGLPP